MTKGVNICASWKRGRDTSTVYKSSNMRPSKQRRALILMHHGREGMVDKQNATDRATVGTNTDASWKRGHGR